MASHFPLGKAGITPIFPAGMKQALIALEDGRIFRFQADGTRPEVFANTQGRPLGLIFDRNGNLIVADAIKGLLSISPDAAVSVLTTEAEGIPFRCTNDLDIAADGIIYFTDASYKYPLTRLKDDVLEHQPNGRFMSYEPSTKQTRVLLRGLYFANGVAFATGIKEAPGFVTPGPLITGVTSAVESPQPVYRRVISRWRC